MNSEYICCRKDLATESTARGGLLPQRPICVYGETCLHQEEAPVDKGSPDAGLYSASEEEQESGVSHRSPCGEVWAYLLPAQETFCGSFLGCIPPRVTYCKGWPFTKD